MVETYSWHTDYVKAVACSDMLSIAASTGLDAQLVLWDTEKAREPLQIYPLEGSSYSLSMSSDGHLLACGTTSKHVQLFDTRGTCKLPKIKGHEDNIRALVMNSEGTLLISGSSDRSFKLWDLRNHSKPLTTYNNHTDSIWSLWVDKNRFHEVYSGSRDGTVRKTDLRTEISTLLVVEQEPILKILPDIDGDTMWVSTPEKLHRWKLGDPKKPFQSLDRRPGIVEYKCLSNRLNILTRNSEGHVQLWDTCSGTCKSFGDDLDPEVLKKTELEQLAASIETKNWVPSWFKVSINSGSLVLHLDNPSCFDAEVLAEDLKISKDKDGDDEVTEKSADEFVDVTVNLGAHVLDGIFSNWVIGYKDRKEQAQGKSAEIENITLGPHINEEEEEKGMKWEERKAEKKNRRKQRKDREKAKRHTKPFVLPPNTQVTIGEVNSETNVSRGLYSKAISDFLGEEKLPQWVLQSILDNMFKCRVSSTISFTISSTGPGLEPMPRVKRFNATRLLLVEKILKWIAANIEIPAISSQSEKQDLIEVLCNSRPLPPDINLATVLQLYWRSSIKALVLEFRLKETSSLGQ
eukprot:TRINITY_DN5472_c0_g1_i1.p1 TRINITY_DN5472_c0_g1~~TRINITY_DN5472_c0_g1_i1.p1  ORF type:complete len:677 (+),score=113.92 TRINITY_DN5472_c0_g1_i1:305-2032(+)